ncbi:genetic suppressor element 1-like isoform X2 [Dreissena polymorpha]|nr:genetic suppressor element 1-like isoform X2 [Dreissena polymorpha]
MPGPLICYVCGSAGAETRLRVRPYDHEPYFPFLAHHELPKGARDVTREGLIDSCAVCYMFLTQQWDSYERSKTPAVKRLYWLKRSDNGSFTGAEMRIQGEYIAQVMGLQYPPGVDDRGSPDQAADGELFNNSKVSVSNYSSHDSKKNNEQDKSNKISALDLSNPKKVVDKNEANKCPVESSVSAICFVCGNVYSHTNYNYLNVFDHGTGEPYFPALERVEPCPGAEYMSRSGRVKSCTNCKNVLFQQWQAYEMTGTPLPLRAFKFLREDRIDKQEAEVKTEKYAANEDVSTYHCYICGSPYIADHIRLLHTLPPKRPSLNSMFFPFVRDLKRPSGAEPLRSDGTVIVCIQCNGHLSCQWEFQEKEGVNVYNRQYSLNFLMDKSDPARQFSSRATKNHDLGEGVEPLNINTSSSGSTPKISEPGLAHGLLAIASDNNSSLRPCSRSPDMSCSPVKNCDSIVNSHASTTADANTTSSNFKTVPHPLQQVTEIPHKVCFLCAQECLIFKMKLTSSYPTKHEAKHINAQVEPFFPFLANCSPATGAEPLTEEGCAILCKLCYYNLLRQWQEYEQSSNPADSNRWLRKYCLPDYVCYICAGVNERKYMRSIVVKNFNFLNDFTAPVGAMKIDEGERVVACKTCAYSLMQQFTEFERMGVPQAQRKFNWKKSNLSEYVDKQNRSSGPQFYPGQPVVTSSTTSMESADKRKDQGGLGSKAPPLNLMNSPGSKGARNTATVSPLHHVTSPSNGVSSVGSNAALNMSRSQSSFAAALRKLANQAKDPPEDSPKTTTASSPRVASTKSGPPPLMYTSTTLTSPPVVTIAPTQSHTSLLASDNRPSMDRLHSNSSHYETGGGKHERQQSSASKDDDRSMRGDSHSQSARNRMTPHSTPGAGSPLSGREELMGRGFQPYRPGDEFRPPLSTSLALDQAAAAAAAAYSYPAFLPPHAFPHPAFRFDDPLLMERYRMMQSPYMPYHQGMLPHPSLHPLLAAGTRYPADMFPPHFPSPFSAQTMRLPEHRSPGMMAERQEEKQRELEREREREKEAAQRERHRAAEREAEKQRERERLAQRESRPTDLTKERELRPTDLTREKVETTSTGSKFSNVVPGSSKGLGIADRYPRVSTSGSARRDDRRSSTSKDEYSVPGSRPSSHRSSQDESEKRFSLLNTLHETQRSRQRSVDETSGRASKTQETGLFRPFDSQVVNGYDAHSDQRGREKERYSSNSKSESTVRLSDQKYNQSLQQNSDLHSSSAFHSINSHMVKSETNSISQLHSTIGKEAATMGEGSSYPAPLNVPTYSSSLLQSHFHGNTPIMAASMLRSTESESQNCVSKLDLDERRKSESYGEKPYCSDSECESNGSEGHDRKTLISSGPPLKLDTSPKKIKLFSELGLTTYSQKKDADFEKWRKRRRKMRERSVSPVSVQSNPPTPLKTLYAAEDLCREPEYKLKCQFLSQHLFLEPVTTETRKIKETILQAVVEDKSRRLSVSLSKPETPSLPQSMPSTSEARVSVKRKLESDIDDVFNFSSQDSNGLERVPFVRQLSNGPSSSVVKLPHSLSAENLDRRKSEHGLHRHQRPNSLSRNFAQEFHESVLLSTRQKELSRSSGESSRALSDLSPMSGSQPRMSPWQPDTYEWPGVETVMESYLRHTREERLEHQMLLERNRQLRGDNMQLNLVAAQLSQRMEDLLRNKGQLDELRSYNQERIDSIKSSIRKLK